MAADRTLFKDASGNRRVYAIGGKPLGWRRFGSVRVGPLMVDWRLIKRTHYADLWVGPIQVHAALGDHAGTGGTRYGLTITRCRRGV